MDHKLKCGVLGAGWWATFAHIPALLAHPRAQLIAIQTNDRAMAGKIAGDFGVPHACITAEELLAVEELEAVVVSSSPHLHYEQAAAALRAQKHVLIEKPMTFTISQARHLVELSDRHKLQFLISCPWHYTRHAAAAQTLIREGKLGALRMISILMTNPVSRLIRGDDTLPTHNGDSPYLEPRRGTYSDPRIAGGGHIYAQVCHVAAYLTFLTGLTASDVFARFHNDGVGLDIYDALNIRMEDGTLVAIASTGATSRNLRTYEIRIFGTEGLLYLDLWSGTMQFTPMSGETRSYAALAPGEIYPHQAPAHNLIDAILNPSCNRSPAYLGLAAMQVLEAATISAECGQNILISDLVRQPL